MAHRLSFEAHTRCHMASEKMVAVKREAGMTKMEDQPDCGAGTAWAG